MVVSTNCVGQQGPFKPDEDLSQSDAAMISVNPIATTVDNQPIRYRVCGRWRSISIDYGKDFSVILPLDEKESPETAIATARRWIVRKNNDGVRWTRTVQVVGLHITRAAIRQATARYEAKSAKLRNDPEGHWTLTTAGTASIEISAEGCDLINKLGPMDRVVLAQMLGSNFAAGFQAARGHIGPIKRRHLRDTGLRHARAPRHQPSE
ncbi:hypothetical protein [Belnapia rosea]|uniref:hypothetical protein n=1 Tax=Belnapia rosea TaxID=938405 RepID=UPI00115FDAC2|nr:hypothetical protein [Belnapia rosea]